MNKICGLPISRVKEKVPRDRLIETLRLVVLEDEGYNDKFLPLTPRRVHLLVDRLNHRQANRHFIPPGTKGKRKSRSDGQLDRRSKDKSRG